MTTHDEQARELWLKIMDHWDHDEAVAGISAALAASHLAGWRAAREAAADEAEAACHCNGNIGDAIRALPDPVPAPTDPGRAARLAEIRARICGIIGYDRFTAALRDDIAYLLSLIPEATR